MKNDVLRFIEQFVDCSRCHGATECWSSAWNYWFAFILRNRFYGTIVYARANQCFGCRIGGRVYGITGDITDLYQWEPWDVMFVKDRNLYDRITKKHILLEETE